MTKEEIINEAYEDYCDHFLGYDDIPIQEVFLLECQTNPEFSEKWGLKIEERELTWDESNEYYNKHRSLNVPYLGLLVPTRLITLTYKDKTIESYE